MKIEYFTRNQDIQWKIVEDKALLFDDAEGKYFELDEVASLLWRNLDGTKDNLQLAYLLVGEFDVSQAKAVSDVSEFLKKLQRLDLAEKIKI